MAQTIILKRTSTTGNIPTTTQLDLGEVGINTFDGKMFIKKDDGTESIVEIGAIANSSSNIIGTVKAITTGLQVGQAVKIIGFDNTNLVAEVEVADQSTDFANAIMTEDVALDATGIALMSGKLNAIDTSSWIEGDILYVGTAGALTNIEPTTGFSQPVAFVLREHATDGVLQVQIQYPKQDADDVRYLGTTSVKTELDNKIPFPTVAATDGQVLTYNDTSGEWIADSTIIPTVGNFTATADQTTFTFDYNPDNVAVFSAGIKVEATEYTATNGTTIVFNTGRDVDTWVQILSNTSPGEAVPSVLNFVATDGQTEFVGNYNPDAIEVFIAGIKLKPDQYTATTGTSIIMDQAQELDEWIQFRSNTDSPGTTTSWENITNKPESLKTDFSSTQDQDTFTLDYNVNAIEIYIEGIKQEPNTYIATSGTSITLDETQELDTWVQIITDVELMPSNFFPISGGTINGSVLITGDLEVQGTITESSARKYKENILPLEDSLNKILQMQGVRFNKIGSNINEIGLIADDINIIRPEYVLKRNNEIESISYQRVVADLVEATKTQQEIIVDLTKRLELLELKLLEKENNG